MTGRESGLQHSVSMFFYLSALGKAYPEWTISLLHRWARMPEHVSGSLERFLHRVKQLGRDSYRILVVTNQKHAAERLVELLRMMKSQPCTAQIDGKLQMGVCLVTTQPRRALSSPP